MPDVEKVDFPKLERPPIDEVICGLVFSPLDLSVLHHGVYWDLRHDDFPRSELHPSIEDEPSIMLGVPPIRTWLISAADDLLIQLQHDRFYMNWRKRSAEYPRFNDHADVRGLLTRALKEYEQFSAFCKESLSTTPNATRIELAKIDIFERGRDWKDRDDLAALMPWTESVLSLCDIDSPEMMLKFSRSIENGKLSFSATSGLKAATGERVIRTETRVSGTIGTGNSTKEIFLAANHELNKVFFSLVPPSALDRFGVLEKRK